MISIVCTDTWIRDVTLPLLASPDRQMRQGDALASRPEPDAVAKMKQFRKWRRNTREMKQRSVELRHFTQSCF